MGQLSSLIPPSEGGILPYYLLLVAAIALSNCFQNYLTLRFTRITYCGLFVPSSTAVSPDSTKKLVPVISASTLKDKLTATDQVTPLAARLFGVYTFAAGMVRAYAAYRITDPSLYQMCMLMHFLAAVHFTSELLVFKTVRFGKAQILPFAAAYGGSLWMVMQYRFYVKE